MSAAREPDIAKDTATVSSQAVAGDRLRDREPSRGQGGFTMLETALALACLLPLLLGAVQLTQAIGRTVDTNTTSTQVQAQLQRTFRTIGDFAQTSKMSTLRMQAVQADIDLALATFLGEWIDPTDLVWRPGLEFLSASGLLSMNARLSTSTRRVVFVLDAAEAANFADDDGDGLVDEGQIRLLHEGNEVAVVNNVEQCSFLLDGRILRARIGVARRASDGRVERAALERSIYLRNN